MPNLIESSAFCPHYATPARFNINIIMSTLHNAQLNGHIPTLNTSHHYRTLDSASTLVDAPAMAFPANGDSGCESEHIIKLSSVENCMPRSYIRVCLAFRVSSPEALDEALVKLEGFVRRIVDAKPYLTGFVVPARHSDRQVGKVEIRFSNKDFLKFRPLQVRRYTAKEMPFTYEELNSWGLPPSIIRPDLVSDLPEGADQDRAPVLRVQANVVDGGLIVSFYLHHCIADGTGLDLLISGRVLKDDFAYDRHLDAHDGSTQNLTERLAAFANKTARAKAEWSWSPINQIKTRHIAYKYFHPAASVPEPTNPPGRGCIFAFPCDILQRMKDSLTSLLSEAQLTGLVETGSSLSRNDTLQALLWHYMSRARIPSVTPIYGVTTSKLLIPVNIRSRLRPALPDEYFGSAVDFASVELPLGHLSKTDNLSLASTAFAIRQAISKVDDPYIRSSIALASSNDSNIDVRDLLASNMNRVTGADMYITSWERLSLYNSDLGMGLGPPDWVRKPWSRDPGSCIVLPRDERTDHLEVVLQMTKADMGRLLNDHEFMNHVSRVIE
jgi:trichothecene 3-O-acetyltransferase